MQHQSNNRRNTTKQIAALSAALTATAPSLPKCSAASMPPAPPSLSIVELQEYAYQVTVEANSRAPIPTVEFSRDLKTWQPLSECDCNSRGAQPTPPSNTPGRASERYYMLPPRTPSRMYFRAVQPPEVAYRLSGLNAGLYVDLSENGSVNVAGQLLPEEISFRLRAIAPYTDWIRTFGASGDLEQVGKIAHTLGMKAAVGAWIGRDAEANRREIEALVALCQRGEADMAIVGSEVILRNDIPKNDLIALLNEVRTRLRASGISIPVVTSDTYASFVGNPDLAAASDKVLATIYPFWEGRSIECATTYLSARYQVLRDMATPKEVIISESGWPSCGSTYGSAEPSPANAARYQRNALSWAKANNVTYWPFASYDEPWKERYEGKVGGCWGIFDTLGAPMPELSKIFRGEFETPEQWGNCTFEGHSIDALTSTNKIISNLPTYYFSGCVRPFQQVYINGVKLDAPEINVAGNFGALRPLAVGANEFEIKVVSPSDPSATTTVKKEITYDPSLLTANSRLLYVALTSEAGVYPYVNGTAVIDLDQKAVVGYLEGRVRAIHPVSGDEVYLSDGTVLSTANHSIIRHLPVSEVGKNNFVISSDGKYAVAGQEIIDLQSNTIIGRAPDTVKTGSSWASASIPGGPAASADGKSVFFGGSIQRLDLSTREIVPTGVDLSKIGIISDITASKDGKYLAVSSYSWGAGSVALYDAKSFQFLAETTGLGDFIGEVAFVGESLVVGSSGNPADGFGRIAVLGLPYLNPLSITPTTMSNNLTASEKGEVFYSVGIPSDGVKPARLGVETFQLSATGEPTNTMIFGLGANQWRYNIGRPAEDQIEGIYLKP